MTTTHLCRQCRITPVLTDGTLCNECAATQISTEMQGRLAAERKEDWLTPEMPKPDYIHTEECELGIPVKGFEYFPDEHGGNPIERYAAEKAAEVERLREALENIARYDQNEGEYRDRPGICPYGCDTPQIAREALTKETTDG